MGNKGVKGLLNEDREIAEKLNFFALVFTVEDIKQSPEIEPLFSGEVSENLNQR